MASELQKLEYDELSEAAKNFIKPDSPPGARMSAARGLLPLLTSDLATLLYYLLFDSDRRIARQAETSLLGLPKNILANLLQSPANPKVLDFFARQDIEASLKERILFNNTTSDETFCWIAGNVEDETLLDLVSANQERFIRHPEIIKALTRNPRTPPSTAARVKQFYQLYTGKEAEWFEEAPPVEEIVEEVPPVPEEVEEEEISDELEKLEGFEEEELPEDFSVEDLAEEEFDEDVMLAEDFLSDPDRELSSEERKSLAFKIGKLRVMDQMRLALKGNIEARQILIKSSNKLIQECVIRNPRLTIEEIIRVAKDKSMRDEIIRMVAMNKDWVKNYQVQHQLTMNPKTPLTLSLKFLHRLNDKDLAAIGKSKQVPGMLAVTARKMSSQRQKVK